MMLVKLMQELKVASQQIADLQQQLVSLNMQLASIAQVSTPVFNHANIAIWQNLLLAPEGLRSM